MKYIKKLLDILWNYYFKPKSIDIVDTPTISGDEVKQILSKYTSNLWISDGIFKLLDTQNLRNFLSLNSVNTRKYITDFHDCDDYSYELMGDMSTWNPAASFGMVWGNRAEDSLPHAWNFFINENKKIMYVEPQNDQIFEPTKENVWVMII